MGLSMIPNSTGVMEIHTYDEKGVDYGTTIITVID
jgi:hypothetical protein